MIHDTFPEELIQNLKKVHTNSSSAYCSSTHRRQRKHNYLWWLADPYNKARNETALWVSVIAQAMMDALKRPQTPETKYYKREAIDWLSKNSPDFIMVCENAGMNPDYVRKMAKRALVANRRWRAEPRQGARYEERKHYRTKKKSPASTPNTPPTDIPPTGIIIKGPWAYPLTVIQ